MQNVRQAGGIKVEVFEKIERRSDFVTSREWHAQLAQEEIKLGSRHLEDDATGLVTQLRGVVRADRLQNKVYSYGPDAECQVIVEVGSSDLFFLLFELNG